MGLNLVRAMEVEVDRKDRKDPGLHQVNEKLDRFVESCNYDIQEDDAEALAYRTERFLKKNDCSEQSLLQMLFKKVWDPGTNRILCWLLGRMDERSIRRSMEESLRLMKEKTAGKQRAGVLYDEDGDDEEQYPDIVSGYEDDVREEQEDTEALTGKKDDNWDNFQKLWED